MSRQVVIQPSAEHDIQSQFDYLLQRSEIGARNWVDALEEALASLPQRADYCGLAAESKSYDESIREILFRTRLGNAYRALFVVRGEVIHILHVRGPGQDQLNPGELHLPD